MVTLLTQEADVSANYVCQWLNYWGQEYSRINKHNNNEIEQLRIGNDGIEIKISSENPTVLWNRRGHLNFHPYFTKKLHQSESVDDLLKHIGEEQKTLSYFVYNNLGEYVINHPFHYNANKLMALKAAKESGFLIPATLITRKKEDLIHFLKESTRVITKNIQDFAEFRHEGKEYIQRTTEITVKHLESIPATFFYSVFQECIDRRFEIRVFHFEQKNYAVAISFPEEVVDSRYDLGKPKRMTPFQLPEEIEAKVNLFMEKMSLKSGSLDIIYDKKGAYYFIEVNPVGQYDYVDKICNYQVDKKIALFLKQKHDEIRKTIS